MPGPVRCGQFMLENLLHRVAGQVLDDLYPLGPLERRQTGA